MSDISKCRGAATPLCRTCHRLLAPADAPQSYIRAEVKLGPAGYECANFWLDKPLSKPEKEKIMKDFEVAVSGRRPVPHYMSGKWEVIDVIEGMMPAGLTPYQGFLWGNAMKYICRFMYKGKPADDLHKCTTYVKWLQESLEKEK